MISLVSLSCDVLEDKALFYLTGGISIY
uniref:Uncharacterized protein n=1 Tax=Arundo donax TaxID=35708 RepID=A0A0A9BL55_ARUDO